MNKIILKVNDSSHPIFIGKDLLSKDLLQEFMHGRKVLIVTHKEIANYHLDKLNFSLCAFQRFYFFLEEGEKNKSLTNWKKIINSLIENDFDRSDAVIGFGGGVIGDLAGFVASTYMRGINYIQIPTSLLAQGNAAIGGKTGINYQSLKNLIGTIWYPNCVLIDVSTLSTLKRRDFLAGIPEIALHALIRDEKFFSYIEKHRDAFKEREQNVLIKALSKSSAIKASVVEEAEKDPKIRDILNYGHTLAHAIEAFYSCKEVLHGEAVGYGICFASFLSYKRGLLGENEYLRISAFIENLGIERPKVSVKNSKKLVALMYKDKKAVKNHIRFILLNGIGKTLIQEINDPLYLENMLSEFIESDKSGHQSSGRLQLYPIRTEVEKSEKERSCL